MAYVQDFDGSPTTLATTFCVPSDGVENTTRAQSLPRMAVAVSGAVGGATSVITTLDDVADPAAFTAVSTKVSGTPVGKPVSEQPPDTTAQEIAVPTRDVVLERIPSSAML
jgi:hypothetical protein